MEANLTWLAIVLIVILGLDALACAKPIDYIKNDLDRLGCSPQLQRTIPVVKFAAVAGMIIGLWVPWIGALAAAGMTAYFVVALWFHKRNDDSVDKYVPAIAFMVLILVVLFGSYVSAL